MLGAAHQGLKKIAKFLVYSYINNRVCSFKRDKICITFIEYFLYRTSASSGQQMRTSGHPPIMSLHTGRCEYSWNAICHNWAVNSAIQNLNTCTDRNTGPSLSKKNWKS